MAIYSIVILAMMSITTNLDQASAQEIIGYSESKFTVEELDEEGPTDAICGSSKFNLVEALAKDVKGERIENAAIDSQLILETTIVSNCEFQNYPVVVLFGFFREDGGNLIAIQNFTMNPDEQITISSSWIPEDTGKYEMAIFVHGCLNCSGDFGAIERYNITVIDG